MGWYKKAKETYFKAEEDVYEESSFADKIKDTLSHWQVQRDYVGEDWYGVLKLHRALAKVAKNVAVESVGWYSYPSSTQEDKDGKDWRLVVLEDDQKPVIVNCHSLLHGDVWTLTVTIFDVNKSDIDISKLDQISAEKEEERALKWTIAVAKALKTDKYIYDKPLEEMEEMLNELV